MKNLIKISYAIICILYLLRLIDGIDIPFFELLVCNAVIVLIYNIKKNIMVIDIRVNILIFGFVFLFGVYALVFNNSIISSEVTKNSLRMIIFLLNIYLIAIFLYKENQINFFIKTTYLILSIFLLACYVINFDNFEGVKSLSDVFSYEFRYRSSFGLYHANATGSLCLCALILYSFLRKKFNLNFINKYIIFNITTIMVLISTASRNSLTSLLVFHIIMFIFNARKLLQIKGKSQYIVYSLEIFICSAIFFILYLNIDINDISYIIYKSNRLSNFVINIPAVFDANKEIFGLGFVQPGFFKTEGYLYNTTFVDNWYLYMFVSLGIVGFIISMSLVCYLIYLILKDKAHMKNDKILFSSLLLTNLYNGVFESSFLYSQFFISFVSWILYLVFIFESKKTQKNEV